ncbi:DUF262 domain-containing protein [Kocuria rhizophila]|uniref:DUF262 domain-containing protein n=1 Tax=Kocuria rhizophila TaxID=72000 RepID=UPI001EF4C45F|nr:DUF262 domain-containing protein [Kocuria rhizophila]MCG7425189.1 DUF262 domain-containing protein [Kocuria rhizophila]MDN3225625.1 DUF262 domain-containing protein [Kocuria rhizophila]
MKDKVQDPEVLPLEADYRAAQEAAVLEVTDQGLLSLSAMVNSGAVDVSPQFQRRDRWDVSQQSKLIESFLLNLPVPPVYLAEDAASIGSYAVIDGKQRLTAIAAFFADGFKLQALEQLKVANGLTYSSFPPNLQSALGMKSLRVITLLRQSDDNVKHEVFLRLNTGGEILNPQEIRNVAYRGRLNDAIYELAENKFLRQQFKVIAPKSSGYRNMTDAEFVLRFLTLESSWRSFSGALRKAMDEYMNKNRFLNTRSVTEKKDLFNDCIETTQGIWGDESFKRPGRDQALAGMFDAQMISLSCISHSQRAEARKKSVDIKTATADLFANDPTFENSVRTATNTPEKVKYRISALLQVIEASL